MKKRRGVGTVVFTIFAVAAFIIMAFMTVMTQIEVMRLRSDMERNRAAWKIQIKLDETFLDHLGASQSPPSSRGSSGTSIASE